MKKKPKFYLQQQYDDPNNEPKMPKKKKGVKMSKLSK